MANFAILRIQTLTTHSSGKNTLGKALKHLDNHEKAARISHPENSEKNLNMLKNQPTYKEAKRKINKLKKMHNEKIDKLNMTAEKKKRHMKEDACQSFEVLLTFSPEQTERINIDEWKNKNLDFLKNEFLSRGCVPVRLALHMDEETPHISAIFIAWDEEEQNATTRHLLGTPKNLKELQDRYAKEMQEFNLRRGISRVGKDKVYHKPLATLYKETKEKIKQLYKDEERKAKEYGEKLKQQQEEQIHAEGKKAYIQIFNDEPER